MKIAENGLESDVQIESGSENEEQFENGSEILDDGEDEERFENGSESLDDGEDEHWEDVPSMKFDREMEEWQIFKVLKELIQEIVQAKEGMPLIHRTRRAFVKKGPILKEVLGDLARDLVRWVHRGGPWLGALVIVVGSILLLALTGLGLFMLFFLAATIYAITSWPPLIFGNSWWLYGYCFHLLGSILCWGFGQCCLCDIDDDFIDYCCHCCCFRKCCLFLVCMAGCKDEPEHGQGFIDRNFICCFSNNHKWIQS